MTDTLTWPPTYKVKINTRAKYVRLKASARYGLQLVVPKRFNAKYIPEILEKNKSWIEQELLRIQAAVLLQQPLPLEISFPSLQVIWQVHYMQAGNKKLQMLARPPHELVLWGDVANTGECRKSLALWIFAQAKLELPRLLEQVSMEINLPYERVIIRRQQSRWGSCSSKKSISLNYQLILLPKELLRHVLIHELCHTRHMDHSEKFWQLVASFDSMWSHSKRELRHAKKYIPAWL